MVFSQEIGDSLIMKTLVQHTLDTYLKDILRLRSTREERVTNGEGTSGLSEEVPLTTLQQTQLCIGIY